jgi:hypothetical protein
MAYEASTVGAAAAMAAIAQAIKASGAIVRVTPDNFIKILGKVNKPLVVFAKGGIFKPNYQYITAYKGLIFFTKSEKELMIAGDAEIISSKSIWVPD